LRYLDQTLTAKALSEITGPAGSFDTMKEWLKSSFGPTLCNLFFFPFHELYTAGMYKKIAPQDAYKSPVDISAVKKGASDSVKEVGYNTRFMYPKEGLGALSLRMAAQNNIHYRKRAVKIDVDGRKVYFNDHSSTSYDKLISTLPLNVAVEISGIELGLPPDPYTSVLVLNIGARKGLRCPDDHWLYTPDAVSGFHRVGFYSNVDRGFLPAAVRNTDNHISMYVERAYPHKEKPSESDINAYTGSVLEELKQWAFIRKADVVDATWIDIAYTWTMPNSGWREEAIQRLEHHGIHQIGRYGRWSFQGIADSIADGLRAGADLKAQKPN
jgi:protoporphyrinogen oxidase